MLYVDDGAFPFEDREQLMLGAQLIFDHFKIFGLEMHIGRGGKSSKTECVFIPPPGFFQKKHILPESDNVRMDELIKRPKKNCAKKDEKGSRTET